MVVVTTLMRTHKKLSIDLPWCLLVKLSQRGWWCVVFLIDLVRDL